LFFQGTITAIPTHRLTNNVPIHEYITTFVCAQGCRANKNGAGTHQKIGILKQLQSHFNAKRENSVGTPFPRVPASLHRCVCNILTPING